MPEKVLTFILDSAGERNPCAKSQLLKLKLLQPPLAPVQPEFNAAVSFNFKVTSVSFSLAPQPQHSKILGPSLFTWWGIILVCFFCFVFFNHDHLRSFYH